MATVTCEIPYSPPLERFEMGDTLLSAAEAGALLAEKRKKLGLTQDQVVAQTTVPTPQYLSALEKGRYNVANSQHLLSLAKLYGLTADEMRLINPNYIFSINEKPPLLVFDQEQDHPLPPGLEEAIEQFGTTFPDLKSKEWQQTLAGARFRGSGPRTAEDWLDYYRLLKKFDN